jgi:hypothetical protein
VPSPSFHCNAPACNRIPGLILLGRDTREVIAPEDCDKFSNESLSVVARKVFVEMPESFLA